MSVSVCVRASVRARVCVHNTEDSFDNNQQKHFNKLSAIPMDNFIHFSKYPVWQQTIGNCQNNEFCRRLNAMNGEAGVNVFDKYIYKCVYAVQAIIRFVWLYPLNCFRWFTCQSWSHRKFISVGLLTFLHILIFDVRMIYAWKIWLHSVLLGLYITHNYLHYSMVSESADGILKIFQWRKKYFLFWMKITSSIRSLLKFTSVNQHKAWLNTIKWNCKTFV